MNSARLSWPVADRYRALIAAGWMAWPWNVNSPGTSAAGLPLHEAEAPMRISARTAARIFEGLTAGSVKVGSFMLSLLPSC